MNENEAKTAESGDNPVALVQNVTINMILGRLDVPGVKLIGEPAGNNTRWVFDVEAEGGKDIKITLLEFRGKRKLVPDLMSYSLTALCPEFYDAKPVGQYDEEKGVFHLLSDRFAGPRDMEAGRFACRVSIDVMHSATR